MLTYILDKQKKLSLYQQLYGFIKNDILSGVLKSGEKLPSKRSLAQHLRLSVITVEAAYSQLIAEGYIYAVEKKGYFTSRVEGVPPAAPKKSALPEADKNPVYFMDFRANDISAEHFPFSVWAKIMREVILEQDKRLLQPLQYNGISELREAISDYLYHFRGLSVHPEQIIVGAGTEYLYNVIIQLLGRDLTYAVENPGYKKIAGIYGLNDVSCKYVDIDRHGLSAVGLKKTDADIIHISPSHHYPTGIVMPIGRRQELLRWAGETENRYIIEDDYDSEFRFTGKPIQTLFGIDENEKVIYTNTFSKTIAPSIRISFMVLPAHLFEKYRVKMSMYACTVSSFEQFTLAKFMSGGFFEHHISRMKNLYRQKRDAVISAILSSTFSDRITIVEENSGLHFLVKIDTPLSDGELASRALDRGVRMTFLSEYLYAPNESFNHIAVINYSGIDLEKLSETINRLTCLFN